MRNAKISVLVPTYNYAHYLDETIQSILSQSFQDFELIIVDNNSKDNTELVVSKYLSDPRVTYYKNERNLGLVGNWNQCLGYANAEYIKMVCADDKLHPDMLQKFYEVMESHPSVSLVTCYKQLFGNQPWLVELPMKQIQNGKKVIFSTLCSKGWVGEPTSVMFRKSNLKLGSFRNDLSLHVDWEMWNRQLVVGDCYIIPEPLAYVRAHQSQHTHLVRHRAAIEEYRMANLLLGYKGFETEDDLLEIRKIIRQKAAVVAKRGVYRNLGRILGKEYRKIFRHSFQIAMKEGVFLQGLGLLLDGVKGKFAKTNHRHLEGI